MGAPPDPLLLAVESATDVVGVALLRGLEVLGSRRTESGRPASEALLPAIDELLREQEREIEEVEAYAVSIGPGSFTGLRVGVATVKGLAFASGCPVAAVPTLAALASRAGDVDGSVAATLDARRGEVYAAVYPAAGLGQPRLAPAVYRPEELVDRLPEDCAALVGEGVRLVAPRLPEHRVQRIRLVPPPAGDPDAGAVGRLGVALLAADRTVDASELAPVYGRRAEAEIRRTGARFEF